jgi:hypothetical protein
MTTEARPAPSAPVDEPAPAAEEPTPPVEQSAPPVEESAQEEPPAKKSDRPRIIIGVGILVTVVTAYAPSLLGVHMLQRSEGRSLRWT